MFEETIYLPNYNNGLFSGERLYIGSWLIPSVNTKNFEKFRQYLLLCSVTLVVKMLR